MDAKLVGVSGAGGRRYEEISAGGKNSFCMGVIEETVECKVSAKVLEAAWVLQRGGKK